MIFHEFMNWLRGFIDEYRDDISLFCRLVFLGVAFVFVFYLGLVMGLRLSFLS